MKDFRGEVNPADVERITAIARNLPAASREPLTARLAYDVRFDAATGPVDTHEQAEAATPPDVMAAPPGTKERAVGKIILQQ